MTISDLTIQADMNKLREAEEEKKRNEKLSTPNSLRTIELFYVLNVGREQNLEG